MVSDYALIPSFMNIIALLCFCFVLIMSNIYIWSNIYMVSLI
jgi:hypothetical protein